MSWFPWPASIKKRACRYLLQHYLGQFLQEKLDLEQMSVDLYDGKGSINNVLLDIYTINETLERFQIPFEVLEGQIACVSVTIPWSTLLNDHCALEIHGLQITIQPKCYSVQQSNLLSDSFYQSLQNMTTSMELAQQCFKDHEPETEENLFEGLELFAQMLETVVSKVNVSFVNTKLRLEHIPDNSSFGMAITIELDHIKYFDEAGAVTRSKTKVDEPNIHLSFGLASKCLVITACNIFLELFDATVPMASPSQSSVDKENQNSCCVSSTKLASLFGEQQLKCRMKKSQSQNEPKFDVECFFDDCSIVLCPSEIPLLLKAVTAWSTPLRVNIKSNHNSLRTMQVPMESTVMSPLNQTGNTDLRNEVYDTHEEIFENVDVMENEQFQSMNSSNATSSDFFFSVAEKQNMYDQLHVGRPNRKTDHNTRKLSPDSVEFNGEFRIKSLTVNILYEDPILEGTCSIEPTHENGPLFQKLSNMKIFSDKYFSTIHENITKHSLNDLLRKPDILSQACGSSHHLRLAGGPGYFYFKTSCNSMCTTNEVSSTIGKLEVLECLNNNSQSDNKPWTYSKLLQFGDNEMDDSSASCVISVIQTEYVETIESVIKCTLPETNIEVDISITDRMSNLLQCVHMLNLDKSMNAESFTDSQYPEIKHRQVIFQHVLLEDEAECNKIYNINVASKLIKLTLCFPIPDLRLGNKGSDMFIKKLRPDQLCLLAQNVDLSTSFSSGGAPYSQIQHEYSENDFYLSLEDMKIFYSENAVKAPHGIIQVTMGNQNKDDQCLPQIHIKLNSTKRDTLAEHYPVSETVLNLSHEKNCGFTDEFQSSDKTIPTPFSQRKVIYNNAEVKAPGNAEELSNFVDHAHSTAMIGVSLKLPMLLIHLPSKKLFENLYNRLCNDLLLWEPLNKETNNKFLCEHRSGNLAIKNNFLPFLNESRESLTSPSESDDDDEPESQCHLGKINNRTKKTLATISLEVDSGVISILCDSGMAAGLTNNHLLLEVNNSMLCFATQFHGDPNLDYISFDVQRLTLRQKIGNSLNVSLDDISDKNFRSAITALVYKSTDCRGNNNNMLTLAVKMESDQDQPLKQYLVSLLLSRTTLNHIFVPVGHSWIEQLLEFFDVLDESILGYKPPAVLTELHLHIEDSAIQYTPLYMKPTLSSVVYLQSLSLSSNIVAGSPNFVLQVVVDNASVYLSEKSLSNGFQLSDLICVLDVNILEINVKMANPKVGNNIQDAEKDSASQQMQGFDLSLSSNEIHLMTCADSCAEIGRLITYLSQDGDLLQTTFTSQSTPAVDDSSLSFDSSQNLNALETSCKSNYDDALSDMMMDAMKDMDTSTNIAAPVSKVGKKNVALSHNRRITASTVPPKQSFSDEEFCIVVDPDLDTPNVQSDQPEIEYLTDSSQIRISSNHFRAVFGKVDQLDAPEHFPLPIQKFTVKELSCKWSIFGGLDFKHKSLSSSSPTSSPYSKKHANGRDTLCSIQVHLIKIRLRHEIYSHDENISSRSILIIPDFEIRDRLDTSQINKLLYGFHSESSPKQSNANMLLVKALQSQSFPNSQSSECRLYISLQPIKLNVDQDTLDFLTNFFDMVHTLSKEEDEDILYNHYSNDKTVSVENNISSKTESIPTDGEMDTTHQIYFKELIFSPDVPIRLDYHGKHVDMDQGTVAGLLKGLGQLNCSQLKLRKIVHRHGLLGVDRVISFCLNEWANDILKNQLPSILGGVGPLHSVVQFFQGVRDLIWMPVEQYKRDGRIIKGLQKGTTAFGTSTSTAALELANRMVCLVQSAAETTFNIVSPASFRRQKHQQLNLRTFGLQAKRRKQPTDAREGFNNAFDVVCDGVTETAVSLARVAQQEHEENGITGAVGGVLRQIPPTLIRPVIIASEATSNVLSGIRNQILPDAKREDDLKWRTDNK